MKNTFKIIFLLTIITAGSLLESANAITIAYQTISGNRSSSPFEWSYNYDIGYFNNSIQIDVDVSRTGLVPTNAHLDIWENGFESIWSVDESRFGVPITFNLDWVDSGADLTINVTQAGRGNLTTWPIEQNWGPSYYGAFAAHELGHQLGLFDEYSGGAVDLDNPDRLNSGGLMHTLDGGTLDYYYDDFLDWHQINVIPEPSSTLLVAVGSLSLIFRRSKTSKIG